MRVDSIHAELWTRGSAGQDPEGLSEAAPPHPLFWSGRGSTLLSGRRRSSRRAESSRVLVDPVRGPAGPLDDPYPAKGCKVIVMLTVLDHSVLWSFFIVVIVLKQLPCCCC